MAYIDEQLFRFKAELEAAILAGGVKGKESIIRSSALINLIHDAVKYELIQNGIDPSQIYPHFEETKPEMKISLPLEALSFDTFTRDILSSYAQRFDLNNLKL